MLYLKAFQNLQVYNGVLVIFAYHFVISFHFYCTYDSAVENKIFFKMKYMVNIYIFFLNHFFKNHGE